MAVLSSWFLVCSAAVVAATNSSRPHIVFVVVDDHGFRDNGYSGSRIKTPTIDKLRAGGIHLDQYYAQKVCSPTRQAIHTGRYPHRNGMQTPFCGGSPEGLNLNETLLPQLLSKVGYRNHAVGKWVRACSIRATCLLRRLTRIRCTLFVLSRTALRVYEVGPHAHLPRL